MSSKKDIQEFGYREFIDFCKNRVKHSNCSADESRTGGKSFTQTNNYEEAEKLAITGWDLGLDKFVIEDGVLEGGVTSLEPSIVVNLAYACRVNSKDALDFGASIVKYINTMACTKNIKLSGLFCTKVNGYESTQSITLKDYDENLVLNNVAFAFHPSFFRRFWFAFLESKSYWTSTYGQVHPNYKYISKTIFKNTDSDTNIFFKSLSDISNDTTEFSFDTSTIEEYT